MTSEINLKIEIESSLDNNIPKINDLLRGFVIDLIKLCKVKKYELIGLKFKGSEKKDEKKYG